MTLYGKMPPKPTRVAVEYDCNGERKTKVFDNAYAARRFYAAKLKVNAHPQVKKEENGNNS